MTCDTGEENDPYKISISSENSLDGNVKRRFKKGLSALLADRYFLLLHVPENGGKMQIIRPAKDSYHRKRMVRRINEAKGIPSFYYALSHIWGISKDDPQLWEEIGEYVNDLDEQPAKPVSMRPEKRDTLLGLLKDHPDSYWWIDVLCARTDTPLDIMGDIYRCCLKCIAMIDCKPRLLSKLHSEPNKRNESVDFLWFTAMTKKPSPDELLYAKHIFHEYPLLLGYITILKQSKWWQRVWTWQEMALPFGAVHLMAETDTQRLQSNTITVDDLVNSFVNVLYGVLYNKEARNREDIDDLDFSNLLEDPEDFDVFKDFEGDEAFEYLAEWMGEISQSRAFNKHGVEKKDAYQFALLLEMLGVSTRRCRDPVDYVYGVLGMFQIKIPRMTNPKKVWELFLFELDAYIDMTGIKNEVIQLPDGDTVKITGISQRAREVNLEKAGCMGDVFDEIYSEDDEE